ncbi:MAG: hypothetical protein H0W40_02650 [Methylibium sp.]|uniref:hypothetical protein n=1 Tax=Methylibium sp. TaxID=2067992 RepID=UPI00184DBC4D|nr:hypothetical protein [Methylibium sp.]MBA3596261.1 hypothetical protein [Methylibium sp.]
MGEAKRRQAQGQQLAGELGRRLRAGEFGPVGTARLYLIVLDKSPNGRETLATLRSTAGLEGLPALFDAEPFRLWEASALFEFLVLIGGDGTPEQRSLVAAGVERLVQDVLPRAWRRLGAADGSVGLVCGLEEAVRGAVLTALQRLRG